VCSQQIGNKKFCNTLTQRMSVKVKVEMMKSNEFPLRKELQKCKQNGEATARNQKGNSLPQNTETLDAFKL